MSYLCLVKVPTDGMTEEFRRAVEVMQYDNPQEALDEIQPTYTDRFYILTEHEPRKCIPEGKPVEVTMLTLVGGRWYPSDNKLPGIEDDRGLVWVREADVLKNS